MSKFTRAGREALRGADVRYGGRTVRLEVYVNTDATEAELAARAAAVQQAARGPKNDMVIVAVAELPTGEATDALWASTIAAARKSVGEKPS